MTRALIAGAGIAGTATAIALRRAGIDSVVYESHRAGGDDAGAFLTVMNNGMAALRALDVHQPVLDNSFPARSVELFSAAGAHLEHRTIGNGDGDCARTLTRAALYRLLQAAAVQRGIHVEHGKRVVSARKLTGGGVKVSFMDGSSATGDLLVGADGLHSVTRGLIDPGAPSPRYTGQNIIYGYAAEVPGKTEPDAYHMVFGSSAFFGYTSPPDGRTWWFARLPGPELTAAQRTTATAADWRQRALQAFRQDDAPAAAIIEATGDDVVGSNSYDIPTTPTWHNDAMVVVGDAAHAASPAAAQGASMALEDAVALADSLGSLPDVAKAFTAFESIRREPVEATVAASAEMSQGTARGPRPHRP
jgi:2-polyprenyl-6-methoxyphenol hydroxylase-like FAD-dependent oxidoreductase